VLFTYLQVGFHPMPHFEREEELAMPILGLLRELGEEKTSAEYAKAPEMAKEFKEEYPKMLKEH